MSFEEYYNSIPDKDRISILVCFLAFYDFTDNEIKKYLEYYINKNNLKEKETDFDFLKKELKLWKETH